MDKCCHTSKPSRTKKYVTFILCMTINILCVFSMFKIKTTHIIGNSMHPTLATGDICVMYKTQNVERSNIVAVYYEGMLLAKRIIGIPGDSIIISNKCILIKPKNGISYLTLDEPWIMSEIEDNQGRWSIKLKENEYWIQGDHRINSLDSRTFGPIDKSQILGVLYFRLWRNL